MRTVTAFLVTLLVLIGGGVAVDAVLTDRVERGASDRLATELGADADVVFAPWPVTLRLLGGGVPEVQATLRDLAAGEVRVRRVVVELRDVRVEGATELAFGRAEPGELAFRAGQGRLDAELDEEAVRQLTGVAVQLRDGQAVLDTPAGEVAAIAGVEDGAVVLRPVGETGDDEVEPVRFEPPPLPGEPRLTRVELRAGAAHLTGEVRRLSSG